MLQSFAFLHYLSVAESVLRGDRPLRLLGIDVASQLAQNLSKRQVGIADAGLGVAVADGDDPIVVRLFCPARELGEERGLARAGLANDECHLSMTSQRLVQKCAQSVQLRLTGYEPLLSHRTPPGRGRGIP